LQTEVSVARQSPHRPDSDEPAELDETRALDDTVAPAEPDDTPDADGETAPASPDDRSLWADAQIDPVEIALPVGVGFTLRAYRLSTEVTPTEIEGREEEDLFAKSRPAEEDDETVVILDEEFADDLEDDEDDEKPSRRRGDRDTLVDDDAEDEDEEIEAEPEEVPVFLSHRGRLLLFKSPESLVSFVRSGAPNDLAQVDGWDGLVERLEPADVAPLDEDSYELDLVVENLRGGHDAWDPKLLVEAGEVARDLGYALRLPSVQDMLSPGSSLDDLDDALRSTINGGIGGFMGRRRLKKIGAQTASLGWRTIIGKISAAVDWRD